VRAVASVSMTYCDVGFWREVYEEHGPAVLAFLRSRAGKLEDAEELLQETFVRVMRAEPRLLDRTRVRSYLFTTAHNLLRNLHRRRRVSPIAEGVDLPDKPSADSADAGARALSLMARLQVILDAMPEGYRNAFELAVLRKLPYREVARRTGWSLAQVKINVYRARRLAIAELAEDLPQRGGVP
jgi:RNA polymerase sigma-70 factor (ECF subfamily)